MLPGFLLALTLIGHQIDRSDALDILIGVLSVCLIASANYTINEWLDAAFDKHHPIKKHRPAVNGGITRIGAYLQWSVLAMSGISLSLFINVHFTYFNITLLIMGLIYNVKPLRTKDRQYLDVLSESINNPLRFMLGWTIVSDNFLPPSSVIIAYWMGGAYLMGIKRYAEYRYINDSEIAKKYRRSFASYTEENLLLSSFFYALTSAFFLGVFLIKYRVEFILVIPLLAFLFTWYLKIGMQANSVTQTPEKLYTEKAFVAYVFFTGLVVIALMFIELPQLDSLLQTNTITENGIY
jgi:4-hydroxybenzoate polyprenyltransferase